MGGLGGSAGRLRPVFSAAPLPNRPDRPLTHLARQLGLRRSEWICVVFFCYVVCLSPFFHDRPRLQFQPILIALAVFVLLVLLAQLERGRLKAVVNHFRDWLPTLLTLIAFQEMELFLPRQFTHHHEAIWIRQDL